MSGWFAYFTLCASVGTFGVLAFLPVKPIGKGYFRTVGIIALGLAGATAAVGGVQFPAFCDAETPCIHGVDYFPFTDFPVWWKVTAVFFCTAVLLHPWLYSTAVTWPTMFTRIGGTLAGILLFIPLDFPWSLGLLVTTAILGLATDTMLLGHWYLNVPNLSFKYLQRCSLALVIALAARALVSGSLWWAIGRQNMSSRLYRSEDLLNDPLYRVLPGARILVGGLAAVTFSVLAWRCAKLHSNQSATGILYVVLFLVIVGEMMGAYLLGRTGLPL